jgi:DHA2 family multidrug resistance protein
MAAASAQRKVPPMRAAAPADRIEPHRLLAFLVMVFGMFMAILDIQIVSASLTEIQAGLSASANEITWVQTAYLIAEVVMIPLSGYLSRALGTRILFGVSAAGFTAASLMCGLSSNINEMIFWRAVQGFIGGGMIPTVFATAYIIFPRSKMSLVTPMIGLVATLAPTVGPTVGGYLTDALSWHWLFFINIIPGLLVTLAALTLIDFDQPDWSLFGNFDWLGLLSMAGFLGALEYVLEEGPRNDWFGDDSVLLMAWVSGLSALVFFARVLLAAQPIVDLRAFADRNFGLGSLFSFVLGIGLYGLTYLYPLYLAQVRGYNALMIGETLFVSGAAMFLTAPVAGRLSAKADPRLMLMLGFACFAMGTYWLTFLTKDWDFWELFWPQVLRGIGLMLAIIPINNIALGTLAPALARGGHLVAAAGAGGPQYADAALFFLRQRCPADGDQTIACDRASPGRGDGLRRRIRRTDGVVFGARGPRHRHEAPRRGTDRRGGPLSAGPAPSRFAIPAGAERSGPSRRPDRFGCGACRALEFNCA